MRLYLLRNWLNPRSNLVLLLVILGVALIDPIRNEDWSLDNIGRAVLTSASVIVLACAFILLLNVWSIRRQGKQGAPEGEVAHYRFDQTRIEVDSDYMDLRGDWTQMVRWLENDRVLLIFRTDALFFLVPKDQVDPEIISDIRKALIVASVPSR